VKLFVVDPDAIYRQDLVTCLESMPAVESVGHADSIPAAWEDGGLLSSDLVILDPAVGLCNIFIADLFEAGGARVMVCSSDCTDDSVLAAIQAGAVGYLSKDKLTPEILAAAVAAAANGTGVMEHELLGNLLKGVTAEAPERSTLTRLTEREQQVLALIAAGHPTREVAQQLCYSERTVKNVLHDVVTKLNARSRSQAVAFAVREGLI
jgi:DNA-binding NarL/FixJ family response regulator